MLQCCLHAPNTRRRTTHKKMQLGGGSSQPSSSGRIPWTHRCWPLRSACCPEVRGWCRRLTATRPQPCSATEDTRRLVAKLRQHNQNPNSHVIARLLGAHSIGVVLIEDRTQLCKTLTQLDRVRPSTHRPVIVFFSDSHLLAVLLCIGGVLRVALGRLLPRWIMLPTGSQKKFFTKRVTASARFKPSLYSSLPPQLLHDARDDAPRSTARAHSVLVGHRQQVALLHGELAVCIAHILHVIGHLVVALCLLGKLGLRTLPVSCDKSAQPKAQAEAARFTAEWQSTRPSHGAAWLQQAVGLAAAQDSETRKALQLRGLGGKIARQNGTRCTLHNSHNLSCTARPCSTARFCGLDVAKKHVKRVETNSSAPCTLPGASAVNLRLFSFSKLAVTRATGPKPRRSSGGLLCIQLALRPVLPPGRRSTASGCPSAAA